MARSSHRPSINRSMDSVLDSSGIEKKSYEAGVATRTTAAEDIIAAEEEFTCVTGCRCTDVLAPRSTSV